MKANFFLVMQVHVERVHLKVKQHCSYCEKKYSDVKNLLKHMDKRHNLKDPAVYHSYQQLRSSLQLVLVFITSSFPFLDVHPLDLN